MQLTNSATILIVLRLDISASHNQYAHIIERLQLYQQKRKNKFELPRHRFLTLFFFHVDAFM